MGTVRDSVQSEALAGRAACSSGGRERVVCVVQQHVTVCGVEAVGALGFLGWRPPPPPPNGQQPRL